MTGYDSICCFRSSEKSVRKRVCWELTTDCNLNCPFCHRFRSGALYYDMDKLRQTTDLLRNKGIDNIILSGGEPLLHPRFFDLFDRLRFEGFEMDICSNGTLIDDKTAGWLRGRISEISISVDGYEPDRHDRMRCSPGSFEAAMKAVRRLTEAGIDVHITTVVDAPFIPHIERMTGFLYQNNIRSVAYLGLIPIGAGKNELTEPSNQTLLRQQIGSVRSRYPEMEINTKQLLKDAGLHQCGAGKIVFGMGVDGTKLYPCLLLRERDSRGEYGAAEGFCPGSKYLNRPVRRPDDNI